MRELDPEEHNNQPDLRIGGQNSPRRRSGRANFPSALAWKPVGANSMSRERIQSNRATYDVVSSLIAAVYAIHQLDVKRGLDAIRPLEALSRHRGRATTKPVPQSPIQPLSGTSMGALRAMSRSVVAHSGSITRVHELDVPRMRPRWSDQPRSRA